MKQALFWVRKEGIVKCILCPHACEIEEGDRGRCRVRVNKDGVLYATTYGKVCSVHLDPIEKKPLFHFYPTSEILSIGAMGCTFSCPFCQNWQLSQDVVPLRELPPDALVKIALEYNSVGIAFTYNEPMIWYEYIIDTAKIAGDNLKIVLVTNGHINPKPFEELLPYIDAMNIDLKFPDEERYAEFCRAHLKPVLKTIKMANDAFIKAGKPLVEVTYLAITDVNDKKEDAKVLANLVGEMDPEIPLHISRYFPHFKFTKPPTPIQSLTECFEVAKEILSYVYLGNVWGPDYGNTFCPDCGSLLIERIGYSTRVVGLSGGECSNCKRKIRIIT